MDTYATLLFTRLNGNKDSIRQFRLISKDYGFLIALFTMFYLGNIPTTYERIAIDIMEGPPENAMAFSGAVTDECNMTAIAGAIMAQVAITALSLADLSSTHWFARSLFLLAIVSGCLAVYYACQVQRIIGKLYTAQHIRSWLLTSAFSRGAQASYDHPSLAAVCVVAAPFAMVKVSIASFLLGLVIYQGCIWTKSLDPSAKPEDSRNVFIMLVVTSGVCLLFFNYTFNSLEYERGFQAGVEEVLASRALHGNINGSDDRDGYALDERHHLQSGVEAGVSAPSQTIKPTASSTDDPDRINKVSDLATALQHAAQAHAQCAEADRLVASEFAKLSPSK